MMAPRYFFVRMAIFFVHPGSDARAHVCPPVHDDRQPKTLMSSGIADCRVKHIGAVGFFEWLIVECGTKDRRKLREGLADCPVTARARAGVEFREPIAPPPSIEIGEQPEHAAPSVMVAVAGQGGNFQVQPGGGGRSAAGAERTMNWHLRGLPATGTRGPYH